MMKLFTALIALGAALALVPGSAAAPTITRVAAEADGRISVDWTLGAGEQTLRVEVSRSQAINSDGTFKNDLAQDYGVGSTQTSWTSKLPFNPGTYYVHVES